MTEEQTRLFRKLRDGVDDLETKIAHGALFLVDALCTLAAALLDALRDEP